MEIQYRRDLNRNDMIIQGFTNVPADEFAVKMIEHNAIPGLLPAKYERINGNQSMIVDITSMQSLAKTLETEMISGKQILDFLHAAHRMIDHLKEYLLPPEHLLLKTECIFTDTGKQQFFFCYCPFDTKELSEALREIMDQMLTAINYSDPDLVKQIYEVHAFLQQDNISLQELAGKMESEIEKQVSISRLFFPDFGDAGIRQADEWLENAIRKKEGGEEENAPLFVQKLKTYFRERRAADASDHAALMPHPSSHGSRKLIGTGWNTDQIIEITKYPFSIGKRAAGADFTLTEPTVSRMHARIYCDKHGICFIEDLNSRNGTQVNGRRLKAYVGETIKPGDIITFADQEFVLC